MDPVGAGDHDPPAGGGGRGAGQGGANTRPDRLVRWSPPFGPNDTTVLYRADGPVAQVALSDDAGMAFFGVSRNGTGEIFAVRLADPSKRYTIVRQRGYTPSIANRGTAGGFGGGRAGGANDSLSFYTNPGTLMTRRGSRGGTVALISPDSAVYLSSLDVMDMAASATVAPLGILGDLVSGNTGAAIGYGEVWTNTSAQIRSRMAVSGAADVLKICTLGWVDRRGSR